MPDSSEIVVEMRVDDNGATYTHLNDGVRSIGVHPPIAGIIPGHSTFDLPILVEVPFRDSKATCPVCHSEIQLTAIVQIKSAYARITGGTNFRSNLGVTLEHEIKSIVTEHECEYVEEKL